MRLRRLAGHIHPGMSASTLTFEMEPRPRTVFGYLLAIPFGCSCIGFALSLWAHGLTWAGGSPQAFFPDLWVLHLALFFLLVPLILEIVVRKNLSAGLRIAHGARIVLYSLLAYYCLNFYGFLYWSAEHLTSSATWRMMSAGWLLLFAIAGFYYLAHLNKSR